MEKEYYKDPAFLKMPSQRFWNSEQKEKWYYAYNFCIRQMLQDLGLAEDKSALALAMCLWHVKRADKEIIKEQLILYKRNRNKYNTQKN